MKVRQQCVHDFELTRRTDKNTGFALASIDFSLILRGDAFQRAHAGCANGDDALSGFFHFIHDPGGFFTNFKPFLVHLVRGKRFRFHRRKCPKADVQGDKADFHAPRANFIKQCLRKMQTGGRCGDGTRRIGEHSLVAVLCLPPKELRVRCKGAMEFRQASPVQD